MDDLAAELGELNLASDAIPADDPPAEPFDLIGDAEGTISPPPAPAADTDRAFDFTRESYAWAQDVFFVYDHLDATAREAKTFPASRRALLKHAKADMANFMGQLLPKAMQLYEKARDKNGDLESIVTEEKKGIAELKKILAAALEEAGIQA